VDQPAVRWRRSPIAVSNDPASDVTVREHMPFVMKDGQVVENEMGN
jgi:hypothetical protein